MASTNRNGNETKTIKLCTINICGLSNRSKFNINKFNHDNGIDIEAIQETGSADDEILKLDNMDVIHDSNNAINRGAALYVNSAYTITRLDSISSKHIDSCWGLVQINNKRLIFGNVYVRLNVKNAISEVMKMLRAAHQKQTQLKATGIILTGDFNARHTSWGDNTINDYGKDLFNSLDTTNFAICTSTTPTFLCVNGSSHIDMSIISHSLADSIESCVTDNQVELFSGAPARGHVPLITTIKIRSNFTPKTNKETLDIKKMNWENWKNGVEHKIENNRIFFESEQDPHALWSEFNSILKENTDKYCATKKCCEHSKPYWTESLSHLSKQLLEARKRYTNRNNDNNLKTLNEAREAFDSERKTVCQQFIMNKAASLNAAQSFKFWKQFNHLFKKKTGQKIEPLDDGEGGFITDQVTTEKTLFSVFFEAKHLETENFDDAFYREVNNIYDDIIEQSSNQDADTDEEESDESILNKQITIEEILKAIKATASSGKSVDNFSFHPQMFHNMGNNALKQMKNIFNKCLDKQKWVWEIAEVIFLKKDGKKTYSMPGSYRPICITSYIGKLLERIIVQRVETFLRKNNLIDPDQEGFSSGKNTIRYLNRLHIGILIDKATGKTVICLFVDFEKAFDSVWKRGLIVKLSNLGIRGSILKLIEDFLITRKVTLNINGVLGNLRQCDDYGLPQGSVISPLLFKIFVTDFLSELNHRDDITVYKFADDGTVKVTAPDTPTCINSMETVVSSIQSWTKKWRMKVNCNRNKTEYICFNTAEDNKDLIPKSYQVGENEIYLVDRTKVLGLTIDEDLTYIPHSSDILNSLNEKWANICMYSNRHWGFNLKVMSCLIKALFLSKLSYASHIWISKENMQELNSLFYKMIKAVTGAVFNISQIVAEVILGIPPLHLQVQISSIKHFLKMNIKPIANDRYQEFISNVCTEIQNSPPQVLKKFKEIFHFLQWKVNNHPAQFSLADVVIVENRQYDQFFSLSSKSCTYSKEMINKYIEGLWSAALRNQFQLEGHATSPKPSCSVIPIPQNTSREAEVKLMSLLYKNNLLNSFLYKIGRAPSPMCSGCGREEETAKHILFECTTVDESLRSEAFSEYNRLNVNTPELSHDDTFIGLLNAIKDSKFVCVSLRILEDFPIRTSIEL